jgi:hypothetical protein
MPANWNVLLDDTEHHHALAQAIAAPYLPGGVADALPIPCSTVTALPGERPAKVDKVILRWKH